MKKDEIIARYIGKSEIDIEKYRNLIIDLLDFFGLEKYVNDIVVSGDLVNCYSYYDPNSRQLHYGNNIFNSKHYNLSSSKAIVYILHELAHIIHIKNYEEERNNSLNIIVNNSARIGRCSYTSLLPINEYQAFINSNYALFKMLEEENIDYFNLRIIISNLIYNNYYDLDKRFISPYERYLEDNHDKICYNEEDILTSLLLGLKVEKSDFINGIHLINYSKGDDLYDTSVNKRRIKK